MNDSISRQAAIDEFSCCELTPDGGIDANYAIDFLKQLPSTQPEVTEEAVKEYCRKRNLCIIDSALLKKHASAQHGRWINAYSDMEPNPMFMYGVCSECGFGQSISNKLNYCPNCGADMR